MSPGSGSATSRTTGVRFAPPIDRGVEPAPQDALSFRPSVSRYIGTMRPVCTGLGAAVSIFGFENCSDRPKNFTLPDSRTSWPSGKRSLMNWRPNHVAFTFVGARSAGSTSSTSVMT